MRSKRTQKRGGLIVPVDDKAFRRISATSGWSGYVRTVLRDEAAAELSQMPQVPDAHKQAKVVTIGPEVVTIGPESEYVSIDKDANGDTPTAPGASVMVISGKSHSTGTSTRTNRSSGGTVPDLIDSQSASTGADAEDSVRSRSCSLDPENGATFGGIAGSPVEPEEIDPAEMERRFTAAMAAARGQERTAAALNNRWSMPPQLPQHTTNLAGEVGVAY